MQKSGARGLYVLTLYITDVIAHLFFIWMFELMIFIGGVRPDDWWLASLLFAFSNPLFCLVITYFF